MIKAQQVLVNKKMKKKKQGFAVGEQLQIKCEKQAKICK